MFGMQFFELVRRLAKSSLPLVLNGIIAHRTIENAVVYILILKKVTDLNIRIIITKIITKLIG